MGKYMYTTVTGNWALSQMVNAGWEYVAEEEPGVYLVKKWVNDEPDRRDDIDFGMYVTKNDMPM